MKEKQPRRIYPKEFKVEAVELFLNSGKTGQEIAHNLGIPREVLYRWKRVYVQNKDHSFPGAGHLKSPREEEIRKLQRELKDVKEERDILKKAMAIFSRNPR